MLCCRIPGGGVADLDGVVVVLPNYRRSVVELEVIVAMLPSYKGCCRVKGVWFRVKGVGCRVQGMCCRVKGVWPNYGRLLSRERVTPAVDPKHKRNATQPSSHNHTAKLTQSSSHNQLYTHLGTRFGNTFESPFTRIWEHVLGTRFGNTFWEHVLGTSLDHLLHPMVLT